LPGFLSQRKKEWYIDYSMVLGEYGGDTYRGRKGYKKRIYVEISRESDLKENMVGRSILGGEAFIAWIKDNYLEAAKDRERPAVGEIHRHRSKEEISKAVQKETGKDIATIKIEKGDLRRIVMELLYRAGGLKGPQIGLIFEVDYATVSQERKRLYEKVNKDRKVRALLSRLEGILST
jgi:hypothetical protein